jgi:glycosyltransferase involved in cell wall biosynthesis
VTQFPTATLAIIGGGDLQNELVSLAAELGVASSVRFTGEIAPQAMPHALLDVSVLSSLDEGFPNSLLESMAQCVPIVSTRAGGVTDLVRDGENGLLVEKGDPAALARAITQLLSNAAQREHLIEAGIQTAESHREDTVMTALQATYNRISQP